MRERSELVSHTGSAGRMLALRGDARARTCARTAGERHSDATARAVRKVLARPEQQRHSRVDTLAHGHVAASTTYLFVELDRPGRYGASCAVSVGTLSSGGHTHRSDTHEHPTVGDEHDHGAGDHLHDHGDDRTPHWRRGMRSTFTVT